MPKAKRVKLEDNGALLAPSAPLEFFSTGSTLLDLVQGGGHVCGRPIHIFGDSSTGKTQLATEAMVNHERAFPGAPIDYTDTEHAYDEAYARRLGLPERVKPNHGILTIEDWTKHVETSARKLPDGGKALHILDSFDALSDAKEQDRDIGDATFGMDKPKLYSEFCRKHSGLLKRKGLTLIIISQVRDNIVTDPWAAKFAPKTRVAGGRALKFYASQQLSLKHLKRLTRTVRGIEREVGVLVSAKNEKNKVAQPFRDCAFPILFNFGIDDVASMFAWVIETKQWKDLGMSEADAKKHLSSVATMEQAEWQSWQRKLRPFVKKSWRRADRDLERGWGKY